MSDQARSVVAILGVGLLVLLGLIALGPGSQVAVWAVHGGPPLDLDAPHNGAVVAHIDVLGKYAPDISGVRITDAATHAVIWDAESTGGKTECWNKCWNLTLKAGENPASFLAGHQQFKSPLADQTFSLSRGVRYVFEVWDSKGRVATERFTL